MKKISLVLACALVASVLAPAASADAAAQPASTCDKRFTSTATSNLTLGGAAFAQMTTTNVICWTGEEEIPYLESSRTTCTPLLSTRTAKAGRGAEIMNVGMPANPVTGEPADPHAIRVRTTCRVRIPDFRGRMSMYKQRQWHTVSLGAWFGNPYQVRVANQQIQVR